ncbi:sulfonate ABC transporter permease [Pseudomonas sp. FW306-02-F02-AA]|uniref:Sulfonate ABC transporter permease n=1 Tax=Pseudomonas fluorescens TaxID=294 RepID=A0A0N7GZW1_PSEFL|nr:MULTISPECIES: ABC transporter permease subunit [Pseudomonas]ALI01444.1 sulfonate ABC transporter permease [Pseudomonas fluorescens]PMZ05842.1 sulfonate ABC transporter permease [Pseudomonas sp. FW306-02-F02-AB]PMZ11412.1 sulfonate ABC transporter permease [Pseudomonas sp. FW306-02-H06C]PMZ17335.1 sulfonate ABC transporter permease [Pseudomonas sp. FW306-02-F02-AA]PMZ23052.1 sulfonate ABC transporter permease [Pseudomonas sp. FW306-02-F08-AA]
MNKVLRHYIPATAQRLLPNRWDLIAMPLVIGFLLFFSIGARETWAPISTLQTQVISLDPSDLPEYAIRTTLRMLAAMVAALIFTLVYGTLAAKSRRAEKLLVPVLDILQSVPVLGYISFTVTFFLLLFPGRVLGAECAAIFAIFTSQAWNMTFSFYQSLRTVPRDLEEVSSNLQLSGWQKFWKLDVPFAIPGLVWNMMMSMSGGWFFVVASEAITVGDKTITLPGVGSYLATAIEQRDMHAVGYVILAMIVVILIYDQFLFRPLVAWADKFRMENTASQAGAPESWVLNLIQRTRVVQRLLRPFIRVIVRITNMRLSLPRSKAVTVQASPTVSRVIDWVWGSAIALMTLYALYHIVIYVGSEVTLGELWHVIGLGTITLLRVALLILVASLIWVPLGVMIGLRPHLAEKIQPLAQFLAAFPANLLFPVFVIVILRYQLNPDIWLSPLIVLGTQWYILFNVIAGASAFPNDFREAATNFRIRGWQWWRKVMLPGIFPYYVTGAITASGGAWNASIVSEFVSWGQDKVVAHGLGAYIAQTTAAGDFPKITLGVVVMSFFVVAFNRVLWRPLYAVAENKLRLN